MASTWAWNYRCQLFSRTQHSAMILKVRKARFEIDLKPMLTRYEKPLPQLEEQAFESRVAFAN